MNLVFIIKNRDNTPFMVVRTTPNGSTFEPMSEPAKDLAVILRQEYGKTPITKPELVQSMDASKIIEGPSPSGTALQKKVMNLSLEKIELPKLPVLSISEVLLSEFSNEEFKNVLTFKASSFISDQTRSSAHFEIKGVRAIWDPGLAIPGTNRRGGFRCPVGTRYGGQITDRFGRSCGWGVARRIANQIADIGERLEQRDDDKRKRRLDRRNARMIRRLGGVAETGRVEGGLRNIARRLDGGSDATPKPTRPRNRPNRDEARDFAQRVFNESTVGRIINDVRRRPQNVEEPEAQAPSVRVPRNRRRDVTPETEPTPRPARRPRPEVAPRPRNVDVLTPQDASDAGETEDFKPYVLRKYNEYAKRVREIRLAGGNAGMLTRREWYAINKENLRDAWKDAHGRSAPQDFEPPTPQARRPRNNRRRRRQSTAQGAGRSATRRPTPDDVPEPPPARPVRPARPRRPRRPIPNNAGFVTPGDGGGAPPEVRPPAAPPSGISADFPTAPEPSTTTPPSPATPQVPQAPRQRKSPFRKFARSKNAHGKLKIDRRNSPIGKFVSEEDRTINTEQKAIDHIKNGGDIQKVPAKYMHIAIEANASSDPQDVNKRFKKVSPNGGAVGVTRVYFLRDEDGNPTNQGWVFKAAKPYDNVGELIGWNYLAAVGILEDGAIQDGKLEADVRKPLGTIRKGTPYIMVPLAHNDVPEGAIIGPPNRGFDFNKSELDGLPDKGFPERLGNVLANYILGVSDRHAGNGMGRVVETPDGQKFAHVVPMDLGWAGRAHGGGFENYVRGFRMDSDLIEKMRTGLPQMDPAQRREVYARIQEVYRQVVAQTERTLAVGREQFIKDGLQKISKTDSSKERAGRIYDGMVRSLANLRSAEDLIVNLIPTNQR